MITHNTGTEIATIDTHQSAVATLVSGAKAHRITDDFTRGAAADIRNALKQAEKRVDDARTSLVKPLNDHVKSINARFKPMTDQLAEAVRAIDAEIVRDRRVREAAAEAERRRLEEERRKLEREQEEARAEDARKAREKAQQEAAAAGMSQEDAKELGGLMAEEVLQQPVAPILQVAPPPPPARTIASTSGATASVRKLWDFEVTDIAELAQAIPDAIDVRRAVVLERTRAASGLIGARPTSIEWRPRA
ncbi:MAG TPA: hypothetical protein VJV75_04535 [Candidatus Polarisedimenticolia bacterium]|nr:hypothetical protein [Candidatus Polarisedimenticolia bacterium]